MTCEVCDREGCPRMLRAPMPADVQAAFARMLEDANATPPRRLRSVDKRIAEEHAEVGIAADNDCRAHTVNWRDEAIAGRVREAALQAEVERLTRDLADADQDPATRGAL